MGRQGRSPVSPEEGRAPHQAGVAEVLGCKGLSHQKASEFLGDRILEQSKGRFLLMKSALRVYTVGTSGYATYSVLNNYNLEMKFGFVSGFAFFFLMQESYTP